MSQSERINRAFRVKIQMTKCPSKKQKLIRGYKIALEKMENRSINKLSYVGQMAI